MARLKSAIAGAAVAAVGYGFLRKTLFDRDMIVEYKVDQLKRLMHSKKTSATAMVDSAEKMPMREHEYYTALRVGWNSTLLSLRANLIELFAKSK